jgi:hypothetical protein
MLLPCRSETVSLIGKCDLLKEMSEESEEALLSKCQSYTFKMKSGLDQLRELCTLLYYYSRLIY